MLPVDRCKFEIERKLKRLEQFAIENKSVLNTDTVLKFIEIEDKKRADKENKNKD